MASVVDHLGVRKHAHGIHELLLQGHCQGITETWIAPGAPWPPTDFIA